MCVFRPGKALAVRHSWLLCPLCFLVSAARAQRALLPGAPSQSLISMSRNTRIILIFGGFVTAVAAAFYPIFFHPLANIDEYRSTMGFLG
ncbi:small integral membrane protein 20 isoform X2 [Ascaphus truei]|uniref:small integral membrane protein 20 isoform X2 n=1 Tax=Ascaphus truei TaxID=8439 RepID=UPI003F59B2E0